MPGDPVQIPLGSQQAADGFFDIDDVNQISAAINVRPHLRIPLTRAVSEVNTGFQNFLDDNISHNHVLPLATNAYSWPKISQHSPVNRTVFRRIKAENRG